MGILFLLSVAAGFAFPHYLIKAINSTDENEKAKMTIMACLCFGIVSMTLLTLGLY